MIQWFAILAFLTGFFFSELIEEHRVVEEKLRAIIFGFLAPLFFFTAGLSADLSLVDKNVIGLIFFLGSIAFLGKYIGTFLSAKAFFGNSVPRFAGLIFNFRLSFGVIVATFGLSEGILSPTLYTALLGVVLLTSIVSSVLMHVVPHEI